MLRPKTFGYAMLVYAIFGTSFVAWIGDVVGSLYLFAGPVFLAVLALIPVAYLVGGIGLVRVRSWASRLVFLTALCEFAIYVVSGFFLTAVYWDKMTQDQFVYVATHTLPTFVAPSVIGYLAIKLRSHPEFSPPV
jgi:hypothetical protein